MISIEVESCDLLMRVQVTNEVFGLNSVDADLTSSSERFVCSAHHQPNSTPNTRKIIQKLYIEHENTARV